MNHMTSIARSAGQVCARFTALFQRISKDQDSIQQINSYTHLWITRVQHAFNAGVIHILDKAGTLWARAHQGLRASRRSVARSVAIVIGIALSIANASSTQGSIDPIKSVKQLADYQLTDLQFHCHNRITYIESRNNLNARNGSHYGIYQGRSIALKGAPADYQFYWYWSYVSHRYGITRYDEPDYCKALHHLIVKGWQ